MEKSLNDLCEEIQMQTSSFSYFRYCFVLIGKLEDQPYFILLHYIILYNEEVRALFIAFKDDRFFLDRLRFLVAMQLRLSCLFFLINVVDVRSGSGGIYFRWITPEKSAVSISISHLVPIFFLNSSADVLIDAMRTVVEKKNK